MKATAQAPTNIAFVKYMGNDSRGELLPGDEGRKLPENGSISMCLDGLHTITTVEFSDEFTEDTFVLDGETVSHEASRAFDQINRIRSIAGISVHVRIESINNFGKSRGLSSSASGFAALTVAGAKAAHLELSERELSILARKGSGSASRSIPDGFVEWKAARWDGDSMVEDSYAETIYAPDYWDIADVVAVTEVPAKATSTTQAHSAVHSSRYQEVRNLAMSGKLDACRQYIQSRDFTSFGCLLEEEAMDLHTLFISSGIRYLRSETLRIIEAVETWRDEVAAYFTMNTGQDVHIICEGKDITTVSERAKAIPGVVDVIVNKPSVGTRLIGRHLF